MWLGWWRQEIHVEFRGIDLKNVYSEDEEEDGR
jgi:hypothetical protein